MNTFFDLSDNNGKSNQILFIDVSELENGLYHIYMQQYLKSQKMNQTMQVLLYKKVQFFIHSEALALFGSSFFFVKAAISALSLSRSDISGTIGSLVSPF